MSNKAVLENVANAPCQTSTLMPPPAALMGEMLPPPISQHRRWRH